MNFTLVLTLLVVMFTIAVMGDPRLITAKRRFPGERRLGATNYGQYVFGRNGYQARHRSGRRGRRGRG